MSDHDPAPVVADDAAAGLAERLIEESENGTIAALFEPLT